MLTCVYHPIDSCRVVEDDEATKLKDTGVWFDCPRKAKAYKDEVSRDIQNETKTKAQNKRGIK